MSDITEYGQHELSLLVYNTENLYNLRHSLTKYNLEDKTGILCTEEQWEQFERDLEEE